MEHSPSVKCIGQKKSDWRGSSQSRGNQNEAAELTQQEIEEMSHSFDNAIRWMELAKVQYDELGNVVVNVCRALGNIEIPNIDAALSQVAQKQEVVERDTRINQLTGKGGVADPATEGGKESQARRVKDSGSPQADWALRRARPESGGPGNPGFMTKQWQRPEMSPPSS